MMDFSHSLMKMWSVTQKKDKIIWVILLALLASVHILLVISFFIISFTEGEITTKIIKTITTQSKRQRSRKETQQQHSRKQEKKQMKICLILYEISHFLLNDFVNKIFSSFIIIIFVVFFSLYLLLREFNISYE